MSAPLSEQQLAEIRAAAVRAVELHPSTTFMAPCESLADAVLDAAMPALLAEVARLRAERDAFADRVDTLTAVAKSNKRAYAETVATVARLEQKSVELERIANAERERVAELEAQAAESNVCADCGHIEAAHKPVTNDPDEGGCDASGARICRCTCVYFIPGGGA